VALAIALVVTQRKKEPEVIKIGAVLPLTGAAANHGQDAKDGITLAVNEINDKGGVQNRLVKIIFEDSRSTTDGCVSGVQKLIQIDKVPVILGPISSSDVLAVAPVVEKTKTVLFTPSASSPEISQAGDYVFRNSLLAPPQGQKMADFSFYQLKQTTVAILYINDDTGRGYQESFKKAFESLGGNVVFTDTYNREDTDFKTQIIKLKSGGAKSVYVPGIPQTMGLIIKQSAELGYNPIFLGNIGIEGEDLLTIAGSLAKNVFYTSVEVSEKFIETYEKAFGRMPRIAAPLAYDAARIAIMAIANAGYDSIAIKEYLYKITGYEGVTGVVKSFDANGDAQREIIIKTIKNGKFVPLDK
jgi:branched-chain amino acid transport system substrate-binding protein